jgi:LCP family protein required for cell wall assembly
VSPLRSEAFRSHWHAFVTRFVTALLVVTVATAGGIGYAYWFANDQIVNHTRSVKIPKEVLPDVKPAQPANYLIVGSDSRAFVHDPIALEHFGDPKYQTGQRSDTIMIAHVDPKAPNKGFLLSIPRDLWVSIPGHGQQRINAAYNFGPTTLIQTIEQNFHVTINHYLEVGFATFAQMVNAIGSVHIFFPTPAFDKYTGLDVKNPGCIALNGLEALQYVRSRHYRYPTADHHGPNPATDWYEEPDSDFGRIRRQQYFIRSLAQEAISKGARNPFTARALLEKTVPNLVRDSGMGLSDFLALVRAFRSVDPSAVQMETLPVTEGHVGGNDVLFIDQAKADPMLQQLRTFITQTQPAKVPNIPPKDIAVQVLNGSGVKGIAATTKTALTGFGFADGGAAGDADRHDYAQTEVRYVPGALGKAQVVASYLGGVGQLKALPGASGGAAVVVVLGRDFQSVVKPGSHPTVPSSTSSTLPPNPGSTPGVTPPTTVAGKPQVGCG